MISLYLRAIGLSRPLYPVAALEPPQSAGLVRRNAGSLGGCQKIPVASQRSRS
jgi:hypothetical protein